VGINFVFAGAEKWASLICFNPRVAAAEEMDNSINAARRWKLTFNPRAAFNYSPNKMKCCSFPQRERLSFLQNSFIYYFPEAAHRVLIKLVGAEFICLRQ